MTIFDTSGIEAWVTENNPKYANKIIKQLKAYAKANNFDSNYDPYKAAYGSMPSHSAANDQIKQLYVDGHFCYAYKIGIVTNGLGIIRHLDFYNKDFLAKHPELEPNKKSDSPDEDKSIHDARLLIPTLMDFFKAHPLINPKTFLGDAAFDSTVERSINHFKDSFCLAGRKTQNEKTLHADLILAGITQLITVVLADKIHHHEYIRSIKPLIA